MRSVSCGEASDLRVVLCCDAETNVMRRDAMSCDVLCCVVVCGVVW